MRLYEFVVRKATKSPSKDSVLTKVGIKDKEKSTKPDGTFSTLGTNNVKPVPLTANDAVEVDNKEKKQKSSS